ncbi:MAG: DUF4221 family protein [Cyclobacteriaceae bacterium]|nr:DUF4221 family protein [Cyclobacteriaceae bacterium]
MASLILFFIFFSCSKRKQEFTFSKFKSVDSLEVLLPLQYIPITYWTTFTTNQQTFLVEYGLDSNGDLLILQVDFNQRSYLEPLLIPREGPNGFNSSSVALHFHTIDSIFVFPATQNRFFLYNSEAQKVDEFLYNSPDFARYYRSGFYSNAVLINEGLAIPTVSDIRYDDQDYFGKEIPLRLYDLQEEEFVNQFCFPDYLKGSFLPSELSGPILEKMGDDRLVVNYRFSDSLYILTAKEKTRDAVYCGIPQWDVPPLLSRYPNRGQELDYKIKEPDFETVFFRNGKIYRIVSHLKDKKYYELSGFEILEKNLRGVTLIELDLETKQQRFYEMPIAKYFVFDKDFLIVGGVSSREENGDIYRKFYKYSF